MEQIPVAVADHDPPQHGSQLSVVVPTWGQARITSAADFLRSISELQTMIRRNMDRNKKEELDNLTNSRLQTMIRRNMDRNRPTTGLFAGQIPCYKRYTIADHLYGR